MDYATKHRRRISVVNNIVKKIFMMVSIIIMLTVNKYENRCFANKDSDSIKQLDIEEQYVNDRNQYEFIDKKIDDDLKSKTGIISEKLETTLNNKGYFDDDIERLDEYDILSLEDAELDNISVLTEYYAIPDTKDNDIMIRLTSEEVDMLIGAEYYNKENDLDSAIYERVKNESLKVVTGNKGKERYAYLKKTLILSKTDYYYSAHEKTKYYYEIIETLSWIKMPVYRQVDEYEIEWTGIMYEKMSPSEWGEWKEQNLDKEYMSPSVLKVYDEEKYYIEKNDDGSKKDYSLTKSVQQDIQFDISREKLKGVNTLLKNKVETTKNGKEYTNYYNETIKVRAYLKVSEYGDNISVYETYKHSAKDDKADNSKCIYIGIAVTVIIAASIVVFLMKKKNNKLL